MATATQKVTIQVKEFEVVGYQLAEDGRSLLLFTHRQVGEIIGKTKATAGRFLKQHAEELPPPIKAKIPERNGAIALTPATSAVAYWQKQASLGNAEAAALIAALDGKPMEEFEIVKQTAALTAPAKETETENNLQLIAEGIEIASKWMEEAGVDKAAIAHWRLTELQKKVPRTKRCCYFSPRLL